MYRLVFFGSSHHCLVTLNALQDSGGYQIAAVVTQPPKPVGRKQILTPTAVENWAVEHNVEVIKPVSWKKELSGNERQRLTDLGAEVGVLSNYGKILPQSVIDIFPKGIVNIHPSLLPKYRGPAPAVGAILNGDTVSGTSIMLLSAEMDAGPVLGTVEFDVMDDEVPETYYEKGFRLGTEKLLEVLPQYLDGSLEPVAQDPSRATYTNMLKKEDGKIDWTKSALEIDRHVRAYTPWPGTWTEVQVGESHLLVLPMEMQHKIGVFNQISDLRSQILDLKTLRLKILRGHVDGESFVPDEVHLEGAQRQPWAVFRQRLFFS